MPQVLEISLIRKKTSLKVKEKAMTQYTITYRNVVKKILEKLDMVMFGVKYLKKWTSVFL